MRWREAGWTGGEKGLHSKPGTQHYLAVDAAEHSSVDRYKRESAAMKEKRTKAGEGEGIFGMMDDRQTDGGRNAAGPANKRVPEIGGNQFEGCSVSGHPH